MLRRNKTSKSLRKRIKITGSGKIIKRYPHQNHFNAKESGNRTRLKKTTKQVPNDLIKSIRALTPNG